MPHTLNTYVVTIEHFYVVITLFKWDRMYALKMSYGLTNI